MKSRLIRFGMVFLAFLSLYGCAEQRIIEEMGFIEAVGYDQYKDEDETAYKYLVTASIPQFLPTAEKKSEVIIAAAHSPKDARLRMGRKSERNIVTGQLRSIVINDELAKEGIQPILDTYNRDPAIGINFKIVIANGSAHEIINDEYPEHDRTGNYIDDLLEKEARYNYSPETNIHQFNRDYLDDGIDPVTAIIKKGDGNIIIDGIALFKGDRYVGKLHPKLGRIFSIIKDNRRGGDLHTKLTFEGEDEEFTFAFIQSKKKVTPDVTDPVNPILHINLTLKMHISEYIGEQDLSEDETINRLENVLAEHMVQEIQSLFKEVQALKADPFGFARFIRNSLSYEQWEALDWDEAYQNLKLHVTVDAVIRDLGFMK